MNILAVDDEKLALGALESALRRALPQAQVHGFRDSGEALAFADGTFCEAAFLDVQMREMNGLELAKRLKELHGHTNIVFVTGYTEYALDAVQMYASAYLLKPITPAKVLDAMAHLREALPQAESAGRVRVQCFGNFEVFAGGKPLVFRYSKTKELLAYLVDRKGAAVSSDELVAVLWEDKPVSASLRSQLRNSTADLGRALAEAGFTDVLIKTRRSLCVDTDKLECDYYRFLKGDMAAVNAYCGEYMRQYSWAEMTTGALSLSQP